MNRTRSPKKLIICSFTAQLLVCSLANAEIRKVVVTGDLSPISGGITFDGGGYYSLNDDGQVAFMSILSGPGIDTTNRLGVFKEVENNEGFSVVARTGIGSPLGPGVDFSEFHNLRFNDHGETAFIARLTGDGIDSGNDTIIFNESGSDGLFLVAHEGSPSPVGGGTNFADLIGSGAFLYTIIDHLAFSDSGKTVFRTTADDFPIIPRDWGVFSRESESDPIVIAQDGTPAPVPGEFDFQLFSSPVLNNAGQIAFVGNLPRMPGSAVFIEGRANELTSIAVTGSPSPAGEGINFGFFHFGISINDSGHTAFFSFLRGSGINDANDSALFSEGRGNGLELIAREGNATPIGEGVRFGNLDDGGQYYLPLINDRGDTVFVTRLSGSDVDETNDFGIFRDAIDHGLELVARRGDDTPIGQGIKFNFFSPPSQNSRGQDRFSSKPYRYWS